MKQYLEKIHLSHIKTHAGGGKTRYFVCKCLCGNICVVGQSQIKTSSCGCRRIESNKSRTSDLVGQKFNRLEVVDYSGEGLWLCKCSCGKFTNVKSANLKNGNTKSCGCLQKEKASKSITKVIKAYRTRMGFSEDFKITDSYKSDRVEFTNTLSPEIMKRDKYTCQMCGTIGVRLEVHHISPWSVDADRRFDRLNLVCLCRECHLISHNKNTKGPVNFILSGFLSGIARENELLAAKEPTSAKG